MRAAIVGIAGPVLSAAEAGWLRAAAPAGVILFGRNVVDPVQLRQLTAALRAVLPGDAVLMVDQEGGRVARLRPPHWRAHPPAGRIGMLHAIDPAAGTRAAWLTGALIGADCAGVGFDVVCAPVLDRRVAGAHDVVGDRSYSEDVEAVSVLARAMADGLLAAGVQPVGKHAPGHGRAACDSHLDLPRVAAMPEDDLIPFARLADLPWMMTAHILFEAWDPVRPGTLSPSIINGILRERIGCRGVIVSDDLAMQALRGSPAERALGCLQAGCDIALYCAGDAEPTQAVLNAVPELTAPASERLAAARRQADVARQSLQPDPLAAEREALLARVPA